MIRPFIVTEPVVDLILPARVAKNVVFPAPLEPPEIQFYRIVYDF